jgi:hypothetical protein
MGFFDRLKNGWELAKISLRTINDNRELLLFPVFSTISLILILATFFGGTYILIGDSIESVLENENVSDIFAYGMIFIYYLINFFIVVFFNSALIHCAMKHFNNEPTSLSDGFQFSLSRIGKIFSWAVVSATVGTILQIISETGKIGQFVASLIGSGWSILTFFVVPVLIYEDKSVFAAVKSSTNMMKEKWGESLAGNVSFSLIMILGLVASIAIGFLLGYIHPIVGIAVGFILAILVFTIISAAKTVFVAAVYNHVKGLPIGDFDGDTLDSVFMPKA